MNGWVSRSKKIVVLVRALQSKNWRCRQGTDLADRGVKPIGGACLDSQWSKIVEIVARVVDGLLCDDDMFVMEAVNPVLDCYCFRP